MPTKIKIQPLAANSYENRLIETDPDAVYANAVLLDVFQIPAERRYSLIQFWLDSIPEGSIITQAKFGFHCVSQVGGTKVRIFQVVDAWYNDEVTWNNRPINGTTPYEIDVEAGEDYEVDITALAQYWINNLEWNLGLCLVADLCEETQITLTGSPENNPATCPYLEITYVPGLEPLPPAPHGSTHEPGGDDEVHFGVSPIFVPIRDYILFSGGSLVFVVDTTQGYNFVTANGGNQNDAISYNVYLHKGTYTLYLLNRRYTNRGIVTVYIDPVDTGPTTSYGTIDLYGADASNVQVSLANIVIPESGLKRVTLKVATKNASSSGYYLIISSINFVMTAMP